MKIPIQLQALIVHDPLEVHVWDEAVPKREYGGPAIASLFPHASRCGIEGEWVVAWQQARESAAEAIRLASDEEHAEAMGDRAAKINAAPKKEISVSTPGGKGPTLRPRTLKNNVGPILGATVVPGSDSEAGATTGKTEAARHAASDKAARSRIAYGADRLLIAIWNRAAGGCCLRRWKPRRRNGWLISATGMPWVPMAATILGDLHRKVLKHD